MVERLRLLICFLNHIFGWRHAGVFPECVVKRRLAVKAGVKRDIDD